ncbi:MAG: S41 family peptidase [Flavobacteriaceae bacterium]|nr:S41 family peptidase [Flavobacteriaceae bacterium]
MSYKKKYLPIIISTAIAVGFWLGNILDYGDPPSPIFASNPKKEKLNKLIDYIDHEYVDEVNTDSIVDVTVDRILSNLDPHSTYIPKDELQSITDNMNGNFVGIGISFYIQNDTLAVVEAIEGGPTKKARLKDGDRILYAKNDTLYGEDIDSEKVISRLKGEKGTPVKLTVLREGDLLDFNIKRGEVPIRSVLASYLLNDNTGYIKIDRFAETTYDEFKTALIALLDENITGLVLDLRDNPGGIMQRAEEIADEFLEDDKLIVYTKNKKGNVEESYATSKGIFEQGHVYVLMNENSASASEIIAGALQDNDKGTIVGTRSFGKGLVQKEMLLDDGSAVRLTVSRYYTPTGRSIQRDYKNGKKDYYTKYLERYQNGELENVDSIPVVDSLKYVTKGGKIVYGGGGIIPDVFVAKDDSYDNELVMFLSRTLFLRDFVFEEIDNNRKGYEEITRNEFLYDFEVSERVFKNFQVYTRARNIELDYVVYEAQIKMLIKAKMAEQLFDKSTYYQILNKNDSAIKKIFDIQSVISE